MLITEGHEQLELRSVIVPALPLYAAILVGGALAVAVGSTVPRLIGLLLIGAAFLVVDVVHIKRALFTIVILEIPLQLDIFLNQDATSLTDTNGFNVSLTTLCLVALYMLWIAEWAAGKNRTLRMAATVMPAAIYGAVVMGSVLVAEDVRLALFEANVVGQALLLLAYVVHAVRTRRDVLLVVVLFLFGLTIQGFIAVAQEMAGVTFQLGPIRADIVGGRVAGTLRHANRLGSFAALTFGPALGLAMAGGIPRAYRLYGGASFLLGILTVLLSQSRGALVGAFVGTAIAVGLAFRRRWLTKHTLLAGGVVIAVIVATQFNLVSTRLRGFDDQNVVGRFRLMELSFSMIREYPLLGVGPNHFFQALRDFVTVDFNGVWLATVHNKYLLVWVETGAVGLIAFLNFLAAIVRRGSRAYRAEDPFLSPIALGFMASVIAVMVHMNFDKFAARSDVHMLWLVAGIVFAIDRLAARRPPPQSVV